MFESVAGFVVELLKVPPPVQLQLANTYPVEGTAVSVALPPDSTVATDDEAVPPVAELIVIEYVITVKVAVTALDEFIVTEQVELLPEHAPLHVTEYPLGIVAVKVTDELSVYESLQFIPVESHPEIAPEPAETLPVPITVTTKLGEEVNVAITLRF